MLWSNTKNEISKKKYSLDITTLKYHRQTQIGTGDFLRPLAVVNFDGLLKTAMFN